MSSRPRPHDSSLPTLVARLEAHYGRPKRPLPKRALDWVLWENAAYLVSDERRKAAYLALKAKTGLSAAGILALSREALSELAALGGMLAELRVEKWITIAQTVQDEFDGELESALALPLPKARRALKRFPGIGDPGVDKILLFTKTHAIPALESNGMRTLVRLGYVREAKSYSTTYRAARAVLGTHVELGSPWLIRAFELLRKHGQTLCKASAPLCDDCPLSEECPSASEASGPRVPTSATASRRAARVSRKH